MIKKISLIGIVTILILFGVGSVFAECQVGGGPNGEDSNLYWNDPSCVQDEISKGNINDAVKNNKEAVINALKDSNSGLSEERKIEVFTELVDENPEDINNDDLEEARNLHFKQNYGVTLSEGSQINLDAISSGILQIGGENGPSLPLTQNLKTDSQIIVDEDAGTITYTPENLGGAINDQELQVTIGGNVQVGVDGGLSGDGEIELGVREDVKNVYILEGVDNLQLSSSGIANSPLRISAIESGIILVPEGSEPLYIQTKEGGRFGVLYQGEIEIRNEGEIVHREGSVFRDTINRNIISVTKGSLTSNLDKGCQNKLLLNCIEYGTNGPKYFPSRDDITFTIDDYTLDSPRFSQVIRNSETVGNSLVTHNFFRGESRRTLESGNYFVNSQNQIFFGTESDIELASPISPDYIAQYSQLRLGINSDSIEGLTDDDAILNIEVKNDALDSESKVSKHIFAVGEYMIINGVTQDIRVELDPIISNLDTNGKVYTLITYIGAKNSLWKTSVSGGDIEKLTGGNLNILPSTNTNTDETTSQDLPEIPGRPYGDENRFSKGIIDESNLGEVIEKGREVVFGDSNIVYTEIEVNGENVYAYESNDGNYYFYVRDDEGNGIRVAPDSQGDFNLLVVDDGKGNSVTIDRFEEDSLESTFDGQLEEISLDDPRSQKTSSIIKAGLEPETPSANVVGEPGGDASPPATDDDAESSGSDIVVTDEDAQNFEDLQIVDNNGAPAASVPDVTPPPVAQQSDSINFFKPELVEYEDIFGTKRKDIREVAVLEKSNGESVTLIREGDKFFEEGTNNEISMNELNDYETITFYGKGEDEGGETRNYQGEYKVSNKGGQISLERDCGWDFICSMLGGNDEVISLGESTTETANTEAVSEISEIQIQEETTTSEFSPSLIQSQFSTNEIVEIEREEILDSGRSRTIGPLNYEFPRFSGNIETLEVKSGDILITSTSSQNQYHKVEFKDGFYYLGEERLLEGGFKAYCSQNNNCLIVQ